MSIKGKKIFSPETFNYKVLKCANNLSKCSKHEKRKFGVTGPLY